MLLKNSLFYVIASLIPTAVNFLLTPYYLKYIDLSQYGNLSIINASMAFLTVFLTFQLHSGIVKFYNEIGNKVFFNVLMLEILIYLAGFLIFLLFKDLWKYSGWVFGLSVLNGLKIFFESISRSLNRGRDILIGSFINSAIILALSLILVEKMGLKGILYALAVGFAGEIFYFITLHYKRFVFEFDKILLKGLFSFSLPLIPHTISKNIYVLGDRYILFYFVGAKAVGVYAVIDKISNIVKLFTSNFGKAFLPYFLSQKDIDISLNMKLSTFVFIGVVGILSLVAGLVLNFFKPGLEIYAYLVIILSFSFIFKNLEMFLVSFLIDVKKTVYVTYISLTGAVLNILLNLVFIPVWGLKAAVISTLVSYTIAFFVSYYIVCKKLRIFNFPTSIFTDIVTGGIIVWLSFCCKMLFVLYFIWGALKWRHLLLRK